MDSRFEVVMVIMGIIGIISGLGWSIYYMTHPRIFVEGIDYSITYEDDKFIVYEYKNSDFDCRGLGFCGGNIWGIKPHIDTSEYDTLFNRYHWKAFYKCQADDSFGYGHCVDQKTRDELRAELGKIVTVPVN